MPFINGRYFSTPGVQVNVNTSGLLAPPPAPGLGLLLIGPAVDGQPQTPIVLSSPAQAVQTLKGGDLLQAALLAFNPGGGMTGPGQITVIRPEAATVGTSVIKSGGAVNQIALTTTSYGAEANLSKWQVQAGSVSGYLVTLQTDFIGPGGQVYNPQTQDNVGLKALTIYYSGTGTAPTLTITDTSLQVSATTSDTGGTVTFTPTMTVGQLAAAINQFAGWNAVVTDQNPGDLVMPGTTSIPALLDNVSAISVSTVAGTPTAVNANVAAVVNWINSGSLFTAVRDANATSLATGVTWTYATGGATPAPVNSDWQNAFTAAQAVTGIFIVCPVIGSSTIWAQADAHCKYMASIGQPRRAYVGDLLGQSQATETTDALALNSARTSLVWSGAKGVNYNGAAVTFAPYLIAAQIAGGRAGAQLTDKMTQQIIGVSGLEVAPNPTQVGSLNSSGVAALMVDPSGDYVLSWDRTTWTGDNNAANVENMTGLSIDVVTVDLNQRLRPYVGKPITAKLLGQAKGAILAGLNYWFQQGVVVTADGAPPQDDAVSLQGSNGAITGSASAEFIEPGNFVNVTLYASAGSFAA